MSVTFNKPPLSQVFCFIPSQSLNIAESCTKITFQILDSTTTFLGHLLTRFTSHIGWEVNVSNHLKGSVRHATEDLYGARNYGQEILTLTVSMPSQVLYWAPSLGLAF